MAGKQKILLLVFLLFVVPAVFTLQFLTTNTKVDYIDGAQPGGVVRGTVTGPDGAGLAGVAVLASELRGNTIGADLARTLTPEGGQFELTVPPRDGRYVLRLTGPELQSTQVEFGWLVLGGVKKEPPEFGIAMRAGSSLAVEIIRPDKQRVGQGRYQLTGTTSGGLLGGFTPSRLSRSGTFAEGTFTVDGLPPERVRLQIRLENDDRIDAVLDLLPGKNTHRVEL